MKSLTLVAVALSSATGIMAASTTSKGVPVPSQLPKLGATRSQGCWEAKGATWELVPTLDYPSSGSCTGYCKPLNYTVAGLHAEECWCGNDYPPKDASVSDSECNYPCPGYDLEACGSIGSPGTYSVFNTGVKVDVPYAEAASTTSSASSTTPTSPSDSSSPAGASESSSSGDGKSGGTSTVGIAVGVVVGLLLLAGAIGAGYFYMRKKKRQEEAEERRRAEAVSAFVAGGSKPSSISGSFGDSRLDPVMAHRRMSDGSIADNEDYSRKILRVTNA